MEEGREKELKEKEKYLMNQLESREKHEEMFWKQNLGINDYRKVRRILNSFIIGSSITNTCQIFTN